MVGCDDGLTLGWADGLTEGCTLGFIAGCDEGWILGWVEGAVDGCAVGCSLGW